MEPYSVTDLPPCECGYSADPNPYGLSEHSSKFPETPHDYVECSAPACSYHSRGISRSQWITNATAGTKDTNPKDAIGCTKPPLSVIPSGPLYEVGLALLEGSCKYGRHNWRTAGVRGSIYYDASIGHLTAWWEGEDIDEDSGLSHISKAIAGLMVLRDSMMVGSYHDDRPPATKNFRKALEAQAKAILEKYPNPLPPHTNE